MKSILDKLTGLKAEGPAEIPATILSEAPGINGLVLAGGHSRRMGQPKCLLHYHGKPQYQYVAELLSGFCGRVFISCRSEQQAMFEDLETIFDSTVYGDIGPMNGVLSAFEKENDGAWFVLGCDYPLLEKTDLEQLVRARNQACAATVFLNPETRFLEPLLGIYETKAGPLLHEWHQQGNESLRRFLENVPVERVIPQHPSCLKSLDTPEEYQRIKSKY
ncbi:MAG: NTP transferase domain-containing protein [Saprospiraceae bacterium]